MCRFWCAILSTVVLGGLDAVPVVAAVDTGAIETDECIPTQPNGYAPPGAFAGATNHGQGALMVGLWTWPSINDARYVRPGGAVEIKLGWWRGAAGELTLEARRTDGAAPAPHASVGTIEGYGERGLVPSLLMFATRGCYEVIARLGEEELRIVVRVEVGRERWVPPESTRPSVRVRNGVAKVRWTRPPGVGGLDVALRRGTGPWRLMRKADLGTALTFRPRLPGRYAVRVRAHDDFGAGPWSASTPFRIR